MNKLKDVSAISALPDYDKWFSKEFWTLEETTFLLAGLNPDMMQIEGLESMDALISRLEDNDLPERVLYALAHYQPSHVTCSVFMETCIRATSDLNYDGVLEPYRITKYDEKGEITRTGFTIHSIVQRCFDEGYHGCPAFMENARSKLGFKCRFSEHSDMLLNIKKSAKMKFWTVNQAVTLLAGVHPDIFATFTDLDWQRYTPTYRRTVCITFTDNKEMACQIIIEKLCASYKAGNIRLLGEFSHEDIEADVLIGDDLKHNIQIDAGKFIEWATEQGFEPPEQLLEEMGLKPRSRAAEEVRKKPVPSEMTLCITYSLDTREIWLNGIFLLATPHYESENDKVFRYLYQHPNRNITREEFKQAGIVYGKRPAQIISDLGFKRGLAKAFFVSSENGIRFRNPIAPSLLQEAGMRNLRLFQEDKAPPSSEPASEVV